MDVGVFGAGGGDRGQVRLEKLETRPVMVTTVPGTRRLPCIRPTGQAPSYGPVRGLGLPSQEPVRGPVVPGASEAAVALGGDVSPSVRAGGAGGLQ